MSRFIRLDIELTDKTAPKVPTIDPIETDGSIFLWDAAIASLEAVPANGVHMANQLLDLGQATTGTDTYFFATSNPSTPAASLFTEVTAKGGIHVLPSQVNQTGSNEAWRMASNSNLTAWLNSHPDKSLYVSVWRRITRAKVAGKISSTFHQAMNTTNYRWHMQGGTRLYPETITELRSTPAGSDELSSNVGQPSIRNGRVDGSQGTGVTSVSYPVELGSGTFGAWAGTALNSSPGMVIYRLYLEDLDQSGRTYEEVDAIDYALFQAAFAEGGKFHGDTWTDPATFP
ncbi:MAG: hypothetical protein GAK30_01575 [Paracidovorax wautersii]|uniref:Minor tail protein n=1 Tax=Paracidovorax wautersii TaxID=1177982 RepID=A0A7V8FPR5_9BURK|nr:MAG: hypothetical protein GAK30_01575 [Paracidovorax wautersii]